MSSPNSEPNPMKLSLAKFDAELQAELAMTTYHAKLLRLLADTVENRSYAQIASVMVAAHGDDAKAAISWLIEVRRDIAGALKMLVLQVALESKEQEHVRGLGK